MPARSPTTIRIPVLAPGPQLALDSVRVVDGTLVLAMHSRARNAACPWCERRSARVQSRYGRTLADLSAMGSPVRLRVRVRRFWCAQNDCVRRIFAERLVGVAPAYARRTTRLSDLLLQVAVTLGGSAGARLLPAQGIVVSPSTLGRVIHRAVVPTSPTPRVLGVDDWAKRRGQQYGTVLVDLERRRPVDLLDDRDAAGLEAWLRAHPGVDIISRDRAGAYAEGSRNGAPNAEQVADRWHLLKNVGDLLERLVGLHRKAIDQATERSTPRFEEPLSDVAETDSPPVDGVTTNASVPVGTGSETPPKMSAARRDRATRQARRQARYELVCARYKELGSVRKVSAALRLSRSTVRKYIAADSYPAPSPRRSLLGPLTQWDAQLRARWQQGCTNANQLWKELRAQGFEGSSQAVRTHVAPWRRGTAGTSSTKSPSTPAPRSPSPRQVRWWLILPEARLTQPQRKFVGDLLEVCPPVRIGQKLALEFNRLVRERDVADLLPWMSRAVGSGLEMFRDFAVWLNRDMEAVRSALTSPWSNGQTEGQITKIKMLKRQMYGRASVDLLRRRLLLAA